MKRFAFVLAVLILLPAAVVAQAPANNTNPAAPDDALWNRVMELPRGQPIVVVSTYGPPLRCRFAGATDAFLFCDPPDALPDRGYRFDRASVLNVTVARRPFIKHPVVLASAVIAGVVLGLGSTQTLSDRDAATVGMISGLAVGAVGLGISEGPIYRPGFGFNFHPRGFGFPARPILHRFAPGSPIRFH